MNDDNEMWLGAIGVIVMLVVFVAGFLTGTYCEVVPR